MSSLFLKPSLPRSVIAEALDGLEPADPQAQHSRRDLQRIHRVMGSRATLVRAWRGLWPGAARHTPKQANNVSPIAPLRVLELGAGDGSLMLAVARTLAAEWAGGSGVGFAAGFTVNRPRVHLTLLDRQHVVSADTLAAFAALGWQVQVQVMDVLDWAVQARPARWDLVCSALFLHHFEDPQLDLVLHAIATRSRRFLAVEPRRARLALLASQLVGAIGANAVTRQDAVLSVHAGFRGQELSQRWPDPAGWRCHEQAAGLFSHCFTAHRHHSHSSP